MKRRISGLLCMIMIIGLCACSALEEKNKQSSESTASSEVTDIKTATTDFENTTWQVVSIEPEDYGITNDMLKLLTDENFSQYPLDKLVAFYLHTDGAGAEGSGDELYQRFMEAPNTVLTYIALIGDEVTLNGIGDVPAKTQLCMEIASADVSWYDNTGDFTAILEQYQALYPSGRIADILACLQEEHDAAIERHS